MTNHESLKSFFKEIKRSVAWLTICALFGASCYFYATIKELRANGDSYFASKIEKGESFEWQGWNVVPKRHQYER